MAKEEDELQQGTSPEPQDTSRPSIKVGEDADEDDAVEGAAPAADKPSRKRQFAAVKQQAKDWQEKYTKLEREVAELRGRVSAPPPVIVRDRESQGEQKDPAEEAIEGLQAQQDAILAALATPGVPADQQEKWKARYYKIEREKARAMVAAETRAQQRQRPAADDDMDVRVGAALIATKYPKVTGNPYYQDLAIAEANRIANSRRSRVTTAIAEEAAALIYERHGLGAGGKPSAPTAEQRAKYEATGTRPAASGGKDTWQPNKQQYRLAMSYTEHRKGLSDEQRLRAWYNEVGKPNNLV